MSEKMVITRTQFEILSFLSQHPGRRWHVRGLAKDAGISHGAAGSGLRRLEALGFLSSERMGNMRLYSLREDKPLVRRFRAFLTLLYLDPVVEDLHGLCHRIILFGSAKEGDDREDSDLDLLIVSNHVEEVKRRLRGFRTVRGLPLNSVVLTPSELVILGEKNPSFHAKATGGLVLWRSDNE